MNKRNIIILIFILALAVAAGVAAYMVLNNKNCEKYSYGNCPVGCIVSSSNQNTEDIGCFPSDHENGWTE